MILVLAGTGGGRKLAAGLAAAGFEVLASAATSFGGELLQTVPGIAVRVGSLNAAALEELVLEKGVRGILDATHPFAVEISRTAWEVAKRCGVPYLRWERGLTALPSDPLVHGVSGWEEAVECLAGLGVEDVFLAVGVKPLEFFLRHPKLGRCRFTVRVLPVPESVEACRRLGLGIDRIIAMQGPGTVKLNEALLEASGARALVIKESGAEGGTRVKIDAALALGIPVVVVRRPLPDPSGEVAAGLEDVIRWAEKAIKAKGGLL